MALDPKALKDFQKEIGLMQKGFHQFMAKFLLQEALRAMAITKRRTPVDYGNLRNAWQVSQVLRKGDSLYVVLFNPLEYASFIEEGHRQKKRFLPGEVQNGKFRYIKGHKGGGIMLKDKWVKGYHMARIGITEVQQKMPKRFEKEFALWLRKNDM